LHDRIVRLAAQLPEARTVALAGGGAMLAHDLVDRLTQDVDLFTDRDAEEAVAVAAALRGRCPRRVGTFGPRRDLRTRTASSRSIEIPADAFRSRSSPTEAG
jgi:hypothetical protein